MSDADRPDLQRSRLIIPRRTVLKVAAGTGLGLVVPPVFWRQPARAAAPQPEQIHLQFGDDAARSMTVSWATTSAVSNPRVEYGTVSGGLGTTVPAETVTYTDSASHTQVFACHARLVGLEPSTQYAYSILHDGSTPVGSAFTTAPIGRAPFRFTSFGDQCTGTSGDALATPMGSWVVDQVEALDPLFHTVNGDLSYANSMAGAYDRAVTWNHYMANNARSAMNRPWMPALGNHENETGNGPQGMLAYQTRFALPSNGAGGFAGNWYAFTAGAVRFITVDTNDVVYSTDFDFAIRGYTAGVQKAWLAAELAASRQNPDIDWIVVFVHYPVMSTAGGSDLGLRQEFAPLFDQYGVDLVLTGHSHDYERMYPVRGVESGSATLQPHVTAATLDHIDTTTGAVHLVVGTGGVAIPTPTYQGTPGSPMAAVTVAGGGTRTEPAPYSAVRDLRSQFGFLAVDVDPGTTPGGLTTMTATFFHTTPTGTPPTAYDTFHLQRPRSDAPAASVPDAAPLGAAVTAAGVAAVAGLTRAARRPAAPAPR